MAEHRFLDTTLTFDERVQALLDELTLEEKLKLIHTRMGAIPRLGIKEFVIGAEVARGLVCRGNNEEHPTTVFPEPFGLAATFDTNIMQAMGEVTGTETRIYHQEGKSSLCVWGPTVDLERDPRWGRNEEAYGEDPFLAGSMAAAFTKGMYGVNDKYARVIPTLKHFYANNNEQDRGTDNAMIPTRLKYDYYLKAFEKPVREGHAYSLMTSYNEINGIEAICNPEVQKVCKDKWGLLFAVTDGGDFIQNVQAHRRDKTHVEALAKVYKNHGADIMTDNEDIVNDAAREALQRGLIQESDIDKALFGALKARFMLGEFDNDCPYNKVDRNLLCCNEFYRTAEKAAEKSVILLKNSRAVLPLSKQERLAVIGYYSDMNFRDWYTGLSERNPTILDSVIATLGRENVVYESGNDIIALRNSQTGFYFSVDEKDELVCDSATINESCLFDLFEWGDGAVSLRSRFNGKFLADSGVLKCVSDEVYGWFVKERFNLQRTGRDCILKNWQDRFLTITNDRHVRVTDTLRPTKDCIFNIEVFSSGIDRVRRTVTEAHNVLIICGNNPMINARECYDRKHLCLPEKQDKVLDTVLSINPNAVLCLISGYPFAINNEKAATILHTSHAGPAMGAAISKTIFGDISPAGRCPVTWYRSENELCDIKDYNIIQTRSTYLYYDGEPLFPFGYGLSYTAFRYGGLRLDKRTFERGDTVTVAFDLENVGGYNGEEVVQLYIGYPKLPMTMPLKQLKAFSRVYVPRGESVHVELSFKVDELAVWNGNIRDYDVFTGDYEIMVGGSSVDIRRTIDIHVVGTEYDGLSLNNMIPAVDGTHYRGVEFIADDDLEEYVLIRDWQSYLDFEGVVLRSYHALELVASNPGAPAKLTFTLVDTGTVVAECEIPPTGSLTNFKQFSSSIGQLSAHGRLRITASGMISLKYFKFI